MMLRRTSNGAPLVTKQRTFTDDKIDRLDRTVNEFLEKLSNNGKVVGFDLSHGVSTAIASPYGYYKTYTTTIVWQEYAE